MSRVAVSDPIVDRLRANLRVAGIALAEEDLERILALDLLVPALEFEDLARATATDRIPDPLGEPLGAPPESAAAAAAPRPADPGAWPHEPEDSVLGIARRLRACDVSPVALAQRALDRIAAREDLNAFQLVLAEQALDEARQAEHEIAAGRWRGPLHGVPVALKDLFDLASAPTSGGTRALGHAPAEADSAVAARLRAAGAVIVGKTRLAECAYSPGSNNSLFGPTRNPHDPARDSGGSSSGSAAAVAAGLVFAATGSDTGGSIRIPAALCGVVGLKPTFGRVSLHGAMPLSWSLDHGGALTRTVADAALLLDVLAGEDSRDARTRPAPPAPFADPATLERGARGMRIAVVEDDGIQEPALTREAEQAWRAGLQRLAAAGAELVPVALPMLAPLRILNAPLLAGEATVFHAPMLRARPGDYGDYARARLLAAFAHVPGAYVTAQQARAAWRAALTARVQEFDLFSTPAMPGPAPPLGIPASTRFTAAINVLGWPAITVPVGAVGALPLGLQLVGRPWREEAVLRAARAVERG